MRQRRIIGIVLIRGQTRIELRRSRPGTVRLVRNAVIQVTVQDPAVDGHIHPQIGVIEDRRARCAAVENSGRVRRAGTPRPVPRVVSPRTQGGHIGERNLRHLRVLAEKSALVAIHIERLSGDHPSGREPHLAPLEQQRRIWRPRRDHGTGDGSVLPDGDSLAHRDPAAIGGRSPDLAKENQRAIPGRIGYDGPRPDGDIGATRSRGAVVRIMRRVVRRFPRQERHELGRRSARIHVISAQVDSIRSVQVGSPRHRVAEEICARRIILCQRGIVEHPDRLPVHQRAIRAVAALDQWILRDNSHGRHRVNRRNRRRPGLRGRSEANQPAHAQAQYQV